MKKRQTMLFLIRMSAILIAVPAVIGCYFYSKGNNALFFAGLGIAVLGLILMIALYFMASKPSKAIADRWSSYARLLMDDASVKEGKKTSCDPFEDGNGVDAEKVTNKVNDDDGQDNEIVKTCDYKAELRAIRANYNADNDKNKNRIEKPKTAGVKPFCDFSVLEIGTIVYGCIIMANSEVYNHKLYGKKPFQRLSCTVRMNITRRILMN